MAATRATIFDLPGAVLWREALRPEGHAVARTDVPINSSVNRALAWPALPRRRFDHGTRRPVRRRE